MRAPNRPDDVLTRPDADRAALIGRLYQRLDAAWLAELLIDLFEDEPARLRLVAALRQPWGALSLVSAVRAPGRRSSGSDLIRGTVTVTVEFRTSLRLAPLTERVATVARLEALDKHRYRATFRLDADRRGFGTLATLLEIVGGKRSTRLEVDGYQEMIVLVQAMARCARPFAYSSGRCEFPFALAVPARCRACPLYDAERAERMIAESFADHASTDE